MIFLTLLQIIFIGYSELHILKKSRRLELMNEFVFIMILYNFVLLLELVSDKQMGRLIGEVIIILTSTLLGLNLIVILVTGIKSAIRKC